MATPFKALFSSFQLGNLGLKNRIVMPPMATHFAGEDGAVNDRHIAYYLKRVRGGAGYITFEHTGVMRQGKSFFNMALIDSDEKILPFKKLVDAVHREGGKIVESITWPPDFSSMTGSPLCSVGPPPCRKCGAPHEEFKKIVDAFGSSAPKKRQARTDEVHMAHGYLLNQFLSPFSTGRMNMERPERRMRMALGH
jgi:2,4-dienoyl-CoA reductase-like NADH-dependent reductase (Old Yellow Enzyme family)